MVTTRERTQMRSELNAQGYAWEYIDEWQPKITLYRHVAKVNPDNQEVIEPIGHPVVNLPGNPDYVLRKSRIGLLPYPPGDTCAGRWCSSRAASKQPKATPAETRCEVEGCSWVATAATERGRKGSLSLHVRRTHSA